MIQIKSVLIVIFVVVAFLIGSLFVGSIAGEVMRGNPDSFGDIEIMIMVALFLLSVELVIILRGQEKREGMPTSHYVKEARKITY